MTTKKLQWFKTVTRVESILMGFFSAIGEDNYLNKKIGTGLKYKILFPDDNAHAFFYDKNNWQEFATTIQSKSNKDIKWLKKITKDISDFCGATLQFCNTFPKENFSRRTNRELVNYLDQVGKIRSQFSLALYPPLVIDGYLEKRTKAGLLAELVTRKKEEDFDNYWNIITTKVQLNADEKERIDLLKIALRLKSSEVGKKKIDLLVKEHAAKYCWLPFCGFSLPIWNSDHFQKELQKIQKPEKDLRTLEQKSEKYKSQVDKVKKLYSNNSKLINLVNLTQEYLHLRTYRTEVLRQFYFAILPFVKELSERIGFEKWIDIAYMTPDEIKAFLLGDKKIDTSEIKRRKKQWMMVKMPDRIDFIAKPKKISQMKKKLYKIDMTKTIKGTVASRGIAQGIVKLISTIKEIDKVKKGDVLVSTMTSPDMTIAMHKAVAIVTDEGGMTCHAAIVSRELGIPCIVGTKNATKILNDGDLVSVDAIKGVVTKIVL